MEKKGQGGVSIISVEYLLCQSAEKFRRGNLVCLYFRVSKKFLLQRVMSRFSVENFLAHSTELFRRETLLCCISEKFWSRKNLWLRRLEGNYLKFSSKIFCLTVPNHFEEEPFCAVFQIIAGSEEF